MEQMLKVLAAYGILQVFAQDLGIKTGKKQRDLVQSAPIQIALLYAAAWIVVEDHKLATVTTMLYYALKYIYSEGVTSAVCFEDV
jgi:hypothetical protein